MRVILFKSICTRAFTRDSCYQFLLFSEKSNNKITAILLITKQFVMIGFHCRISHAFESWCGYKQFFCLQLVNNRTSSLQLSERVNMHLLALMEDLLECKSTVLAKLIPLWSPILYAYHSQVRSASLTRVCPEISIWLTEKEREKVEHLPHNSFIHESLLSPSHKPQFREKWRPARSNDPKDAFLILQLPGAQQVRLQKCLNWTPPEPEKEDTAHSMDLLVKWLQRVVVKLGRIEMQSSAATQIYITWTHRLLVHAVQSI